MNKILNRDSPDSISSIVISDATAIISCVALMGIGAGTLKVGQVLYNKFKGGKKDKSKNLNKNVA